ncbi:MAG: thiamine pyrophosphate-dependent enzyme [bacterium]|nr:thiamine pyrophosphate-dependent enzyme [bacterium]
MSRVLLSGNEAIAKGAIKAGISLATAYPGTPSTEIFENIAKTGLTKALWAPNEKIAVELASGVSYAGHRTLAAMKHVGVNVAADPIFTLAYTGIRGGMVIITADDPELHSSQNEQDNRRYASFTRVPMLEPADSQEAMDYTREAFALSERFDIPFFVRTTTRISHGKSLVELSEQPGEKSPVEPGLIKDPSKYVMVPANARIKHRELEKKIGLIAGYAESCSFNTVEKGSRELGIITSGISCNYVKEAVPGASILKLGLVFPLPEKLIRDFAAGCDRIVIVEELEPHLEEWVRFLGIECEGKSLIPRFGEIDAGTVKRALGMEGAALSLEMDHLPHVPTRPPVMCVGCPHRGIFHILSRKKTFVAGDIGCYTLAVSQPLAAIHTTLCMGAGVNQAVGIEAVMPEEHGKVVAVIGDSTFLHSGMGGVLNMAFNNIPATILILDNYTTAMTGRQDHPGSGFDAGGNRTKQVDWKQLLGGLGIPEPRFVDAYDLDEIRTVLDEELHKDAPSVIVVQGACMLMTNRPVKREDPYCIDGEKCTDCGMCLRLGCPAIARKDASPDNKPVIDTGECTGCDLCFQVCKFDAVGRAK